MEHSLPSLELARPWRRATIVAAAVALAELALIVVLVVALLGKPMAERLEAQVAPPPAAAAPTPTKPAPQKAAVLPRAETVVLVLNGNGRAGAAGAAGAQLKGLGYVLAGVGNAPRTDYAQTYVMYRPGKQAEAERLAKELGGGVVAPLDGLDKAALLGAHVALVLGPEG